VGAIVGLIVFAPLLLVIAVLIRLTSPGPILFTQERFGYQKRRFTMYKFRSMVIGAEHALGDLESQNEVGGPVFKMSNDPRVTRLGSFLRKTSIDELPQLFNVLRGDMSLVGPRPLSTRDVSRFDEPWLMRRFSVLPGLTCIWQVSGRSMLSFNEWISLDLEYIDNWTLLLDLEILARTIPAVLLGEGAV
jgi:lipopolysaccharide/colanic/teichoic acid biosynthesis glycosyltransferase